MIENLYKYFEKIETTLGRLKLMKIPKLKGIIYIALSYVGYQSYKLLYKMKKVKISQLSNSDKNRNDPMIIVSLTTFPARIDSVYLTITTILRQTYLPNKIYLWLAESEFPDGIESLPKSLTALTKYGLEIRFCENIRPHKKYYYSMIDNPDHIVITVDDDVLYPKTLIEDLMRLNSLYPKSICCTRGHTIAVDTRGYLKPYSQWKKNIFFDNESPSYFLCPTGVGGVLYPPDTLSKEVFDLDNIYKLCLNADDLWLKVMSLRNNTKVVLSRNFNYEFLTVNNSQKNGLSESNVRNKKNDIQLNMILSEYPVFIKSEDKVEVNI
jgi:hypothetical protein